MQGSPVLVIVRRAVAVGGGRGRVGAAAAGLGLSRQPGAFYDEKCPERGPAQQLQQVSASQDCILNLQSAVLTRAGNEPWQSLKFHNQREGHFYKPSPKILCLTGINPW